MLACGEGEASTKPRPRPRHEPEGSSESIIKDYHPVQGICAAE